MSATSPAELGCICATARMATRTLTRRYDEALRPAGLRTTQFSILARLDEEGALPVTRLAGRLALERTSLTRELATLRARGLVDVTAAADRRTRIVSISARGRDALENARPAWLAVQRATRSALGRERADRLLTDLRAAMEV